MKAPLRHDSLEEITRELKGLGRSDRSRRLAVHADQLGLTVAHLRKQLREHAQAQSGEARKAAPSRKVTREQALLIAQAQQQTEDNLGGIKTSLETAVRLLRDDGRLPPRDVWAPSRATLARALQDLGLGRRNLSSRGFAIVRTTKGPNHVHVVDMSICRQWFLRPDGLTAQHEFPQ